MVSAQRRLGQRPVGAAPPDEHVLAFGGGQHGQGVRGTRRVGGHLLKQAQSAGGDALGGGAVEQVRGVLD
ncbi:hypothetical protein [Streptomyces sp. NPDC056948]|uniref:hypothetical protein n=1 Tax=Streptomyces sp. NPDC056948 TaxID=3345975 RepID=UPI00363940D8